MTVKVEFSINTVELEMKYLYNHLNVAAICLRTSATQFSATRSIFNYTKPAFSIIYLSSHEVLFTERTVQEFRSTR